MFCLLRGFPKAKVRSKELCPGLPEASILPVSCQRRQVGKGRCSLGPVTLRLAGGEHGQREMTETGLPGLPGLTPARAHPR